MSWLLALQPEKLCSQTGNFPGSSYYLLNITDPVLNERYLAYFLIWPINVNKLLIWYFFLQIGLGLLLNEKITWPWGLMVDGLKANEVEILVGKKMHKKKICCLGANENTSSSVPDVAAWMAQLVQYLPSPNTKSKLQFWFS